LTDQSSVAYEISELSEKHGSLRFNILVIVSWLL